MIALESLLNVVDRQTALHFLEIIQRHKINAIAKWLVQEKANELGYYQLGSLSVQNYAMLLTLYDEVFDYYGIEFYGVGEDF
jgi:hypothetical protein